jgi:type VI secretion system protein ImpF
MAELAPRERLQPSLLDRLTDEEPGRRSNRANAACCRCAALREGVLRDLAWLLNTTNLLSVTDAAAPAARGQLGAELRHARHVRRLAWPT